MIELKERERYHFRPVDDGQIRGGRQASRPINDSPNGTSTMDAYSTVIIPG